MANCHAATSLSSLASVCSSFQVLPSTSRKRSYKKAARLTHLKVAGIKAAEVEVPTDWRRKSKPIKPGSTYPAKKHCSNCGLCDTYYVAHVKNACAFLGDDMSKVEKFTTSARKGQRPQFFG